MTGIPYVRVYCKLSKFKIKYSNLISSKFNQKKYKNKKKPEEGHNGSCIIKLCACRLSGGIRDFTASMKRL